MSMLQMDPEFWCEDLLRQRVNKARVNNLPTAASASGVGGSPSGRSLQPPTPQVPSSPHHRCLPPSLRINYCLPPRLSWIDSLYILPCWLSLVVRSLPPPCQQPSVSLRDHHLICLAAADHTGVGSNYAGGRNGFLSISPGKPDE